MVRISLAKTFFDDLSRLDRGLQRKVDEMIAKLKRDHTRAGLNLESYHASADPRSRTARVDQATRAILAAGEEADHYILVKVLPHDQADRWMAANRFNVNQLTGALEVIDVTAVETLSPATATAPARPAGVLDGVADKAFKQLGITDERVVAVARRMETAEEVEILAGALPDDQAEALTSLALGMSVDEIYRGMVARLDATGDRTADEAAPDPDDLIAAVQRPASRSAFLVLDDEDALLDVLTRDFEAWQIFLHPSQRAVVERRNNGPARVTGGAGTGKTVALLHRARRLADESAPGASRVLVTTFTTKLRDDLVDRLRALGGPELLERIDVTTVDALARRTVADAEGAPAVHVIYGRPLGDLWQTVVDEHGFGFGVEFLAQEWEQVVLARGIRSRDDYFATPRPGRGVRLPRRDRAEVWRAVEAFAAALQRAGKRTFLQLAAGAAGYLDAAAIKPYDHVLVDEAQDLHPAQWRVLRAAVAKGPDDLFIAGDAHQRIYDHRVSLSALGIETRGRSSRLRVNYRTTHEILRWSLELLAGEPFDDLDEGEDTLVGYRSVTHGGGPVVVGYANRRAELNALAELVGAWQRDGIELDEIGICARTRQTADVAEQHLRSVGFAPADANGPIKGPFFGTMHAMKGLEFRAVAMVDVGASVVPPSVAVTPREEDPIRHAHDLQRERCLLYVAATRAREALAVSWTSEPSSLLVGETRA
ncbi:MAG: UvrD-helicase domain-containing protein [Solirubrobacteraceae bacterium MAG38_C4-C5]|nr:UvrD-helicase domain-containing protein [Candidatus Siliceabacter maunaloa]